MRTLDSLLTIAKSLNAFTGAALTGLLGSGLIHLPTAWQGPVTSAAAACTGFAVWLTTNRQAIVDDAQKVVEAIGTVDPALAEVLAPIVDTPAGMIADASVALG